MEWNEKLDVGKTFIYIFKRALSRAMRVVTSSLPLSNQI